MSMPPFQTYDTLSKLLDRRRESAFVATSGRHFFMTSAGRGQPPRRPPAACSTPTTRPTPPSSKSIRWGASPFTGATIDNNVVTVPDFGKISLGSS